MPRAFWSYDLFPYVVSGTIVKRKEGAVELQEYGKGRTVIPRFELPKRQGDELHRQVEALSEEYHSELRAMHEKYIQKLRALHVKLQDIPWTATE